MTPEIKIRQYPVIQMFSIIFLIIMTVALSVKVIAVEPDRQKLIGLVRAYADAMIENGRDRYGKEHTPLFAAALNRNTMKLGCAESFGSVPGVRETDRSLGGANPQEDLAIYKILYELTYLTGERTYANEADRALGFFFRNCQSHETGLMAWGEHLYWDFRDEACGGNDIHEIEGEWPFWDQCYRLAPEACWRYAIGQWDHQIADKATGDFSRHARWSSHGPSGGFDFPRYAGQMIIDWADAYSREVNFERSRRDELIRAISVIVGRMEDNMKLTASGYLPAGRAEAGDHINVVWLGSNLELARCLWKAASSLGETDKSLTDRMRYLALQQDTGFHRAPHLVNDGGGFAATLHSETGEPRYRSMNRPYTEVWPTGYGHSTHAGLANLCYERYLQLHESQSGIAEKYKALVLAAAEQYLSASVDRDELQKPGAFASVIELMINAYHITGQKRFTDRAFYFSRIGIELFLDDGLPLPKATSRHDHYEAITGGPGFMYSLLKIYTVSDNY